MLRPGYPIETQRLLLRPYAPHDLDALHAILSREDINRYLYTEPRSHEQVAQVIADGGHDVIEAEGDMLVLGIEPRGGRPLIGNVVLIWTSEEHRQGEIGFVLHPDAQGHGYAGEAAVEMLRLGFDRLGLHRIIGRCDGRNDASARLMARLGMRREAQLREHAWVKGEWTDELVYAMLAAEWQQRQPG